jgi:hypothetical protein
MSQYLKVAAITAIAFVAATAVGTPVLAHALPFAGSPRLSVAGERDPHPQPTVRVKKIKWGVSVRLTDQQQRSRIEHRDPELQRTMQKAETETKGDRLRPDRRSRIPVNLISQRPFRLNIGICGLAATDGTVPGPNRCQPYQPTVLPTGPDPTEPVTDTTVARPPQPSDVTWAAIRSQFADVLFPELQAKVQPADRTLVNLDTIVYTDENKPTTTTVTLLGFPVIVEAAPTSYSWSFGDGTPALTTTSPGAPYPSKEITHKYLHRGSAQVSVTAHYAARYKVADLDWQYVDDTVPITGPATGVLIREAVPALVDPAR